VGGIALVPLLAFILSVLLSVYVLAPKANLEFALRGSEVWEYFVSEDDDLSEAHRTLAYWIDDVHANNQGLSIGYSSVFLQPALLWSSKPSSGRSNSAVHWTEMAAPKTPPPAPPPPPPGIFVPETRGGNGNGKK